MHVLILPSWYPSNSEDIGGSFFREQANALIKNGCQVGVIAPCLRSLRDPLGAIRGPVGMQYENDLCIDTYRQHGVNIFPKMPGLAGLWWQKMGLKLYEHYVQRHGHPDVIHVHSMLHAGLVAREIKKLHHIPYIITEHSSSFARKAVSKQQKNAAKTIACGASARFAVSAPFSILLTEFLSSDCGIWKVLPNIVNDAFFDGPLNNQLKDEFTFLNVCHLKKNKRVDILLKGFACAFRGDKKVRLRIGGEGSEREFLIGLTEELGVTSQVTFLGMLARDRVVDEMEKAEVFVLSSEYETFGVVVIEALAKGKPVIATRCGGPEDIVREKDGFLVPSNDVAAMAKAMKEIQKSYNGYDANEIRSNCKARYGESAIAKQLIETYKYVMK